MFSDDMEVTEVMDFQDDLNIPDNDPELFDETTQPPNDFEYFMNNSSNTKNKKMPSINFDELKGIDDDINNLQNDGGKSFDIDLDIDNDPPIGKQTANASKGTSSTWDGFQNFSGTGEGTKKYERESKSRTDLYGERLKYYNKLKSLPSEKLSGANFSMDMDLGEMKTLHDLMIDEINKENTITFYSESLKCVANGMETVNSYFNLFDIQTKGFTENISESVDSGAYNEIFEELYEKYKHVPKLAPEFRLIGKFIFSLIYLHITNSALSAIGLDGLGIDTGKMLQQNPILAQMMESAALSQINNSSRIPPQFKDMVNASFTEPDRTPLPPPISTKEYSTAPTTRGGNNTSMFNNEGNYQNLYEQQRQQQQQQMQQPPRSAMKGPEGFDSILSKLKTKPLQQLQQPQSPPETQQPTKSLVSQRPPQFSAQYTPQQDSDNMSVASSNAGASTKRRGRPRVVKQTQPSTDL